MRMREFLRGLFLFLALKKYRLKRDKSLIYVEMSERDTRILSKKLKKPKVVKFVIKKRDSGVYALFFFNPFKPLYMSKTNHTKAAPE